MSNDLKGNFGGIQAVVPENQFEEPITATQLSNLFMSMIFSIMTLYQKTPNLLTLKAATNNFIVVASKKYLVSTSVPVDPKMDSLNLAEEDYSKKKMRNPIYFSNQIKQNSAEPLSLSTSRPKSTSAFLTSAINNLNFKSVAQIVVKQNHGYDIISNM